MDNKVLENLNSQNWPKIRKSLFAYVFAKLKTNNVNAMNAEVADFVDGAICKTYLGDRKWDPDKVSLLHFLKGTIDSDISNFFKKKSTALSTSYDIYDEKITDLVPDTASTLVDKIISNEERMTKINAVRERLNNDEEAGIVFEYLLEGYTYEELKDHLQIDGNQLNNILKRLKRKTLKGKL